MTRTFFGSGLWRDELIKVRTINLQDHDLRSCSLLKWPEEPRSKWRCSCSEACCSSALEMWRGSRSAPAERAGPAPALPCCRLWLEEGSEPSDARRPLIPTRPPPSSSPDVPVLWSSAAAHIGKLLRHDIDMVTLWHFAGVPCPGLYSCTACRLWLITALHRCLLHIAP